MGGIYFSRIATTAVAVVLVAHGLIHLFIWPGGVEGDTGASGWDGTARLPDLLSEEVVALVARSLVMASVLLLVGAGIAWLKAGWRARLAGWLTLAGATASLTTFLVLWPGMLPGPDSYWRGPVVSVLALLAGLSLLWVRRRRARSEVVAPDGDLTPFV